MNYYEHHLGDYAQATAHLSMLEDAAYSRMLRWYYAEEKPLPAELRAVCRIVRAATDDEREAVRIVLDEFFELEADGWHQKRADAELERYRAKSEKARRSAGERWAQARSLSERPATDLQDTAAPHGKRNAAPALPTHSERSANASATNANASKPDANAMLTSHQTPDLEATALAAQSGEAEPPGSDPASAGKPAASPGRGTRLPEGWLLTKALADEGIRARADAGLPPLTDAQLRAEGAAFRDYWAGKSGRDATKLDWTATWRNWCRKARPAGTMFASGAATGAAMPTADDGDRRLRWDEITA